MEIVFWIILWLLAFIGAIEIFGRIYYGLYPPHKAARGWLAVHLSDDIDTAKGQFEYYLSWVEWNGAKCRIVFVHSKGANEIAPMFARYFDGLPGVKLTTIDGLAEVLEGLR
jgi:hypothetical protein